MIVEDDVITIRAERTQERETNRRNYHLVELSVTIPKDVSQARSRRVQVRSGSTGEGADQGQQGAASSDAGGSKGKAPETHH